MERIIEIIKGYIEEYVSKEHKIKQVFFGDPFYIPSSKMPAIVIEPISTDIKYREFDTEQKTHRVRVSIIFDARQFFKSPDDKAAFPFMRKVLEGRDDCGRLLETTISHTLRNRLMGDYEAINVRNVNVAYGNFVITENNRNFPVQVGSVTCDIDAGIFKF
jgi:hypothetical protein